MAEEPTPSERAEDLFADFLAQLQEGDVDFQSFCDEHPEFAEELRQLLDNCRQMWAMLVTPGGSFARRLPDDYHGGSIFQHRCKLEKCSGRFLTDQQEQGSNITQFSVAFQHVDDRNSRMTTSTSTTPDIDNNTILLATINHCCHLVDKRRDRRTANLITNLIETRRYRSCALVKFAPEILGTHVGENGRDLATSSV